MRVFLNPGHARNGDPDPGAVNLELGLRECDLALEIGAIVSKCLNDIGIETLVVQSDWLSNITCASNEWESDLFISIHCNASVNHNARGCETWYFYDSWRGSKLASSVQRQIVKSVDLYDRGTKGAQPSVNGLYVLTNTKCPAILVECGFIDNNGDARTLMFERDEIGRAIARGVTDYMRDVG